MSSRWKCPECGSHSVQISLPTWYHESHDYRLTFVQTDEESDPMFWYCETCEESGNWSPAEVTPEEASQGSLFDFMLTWPGEEGRQ